MFHDEYGDDQELRFRVKYAYYVFVIDSSGPAGYLRGLKSDRSKNDGEVEEAYNLQI